MTEPERRIVTVETLRQALIAEQGPQRVSIAPIDGKPTYQSWAERIFAALPHDATEPAGLLDDGDWRAIVELAKGYGHATDYAHAEPGMARMRLDMLCDRIMEVAVSPGAPREDERLREALTEAVDAVLAYGAAPPEYPGLALVPQPNIERLRRVRTALRVSTHSPHDQAGEPVEGFPTCSVCGAIQTDPEPSR